MKHSHQIHRAIAASLTCFVAMQATFAAEVSDEDLGNKYMYCGILTNTINGGASQRGNFMLAISTQLLGNKKIEELKPNITAAKEMVAADMKSSDAGFEKYSACIKMDNEQGKALFEKYKDALTKNAAR